MVSSKWTREGIRQWVDSQQGRNAWYQSIPLKYGIVTPGTTDSVRRLEIMRLPSDMTGMTVLDIGCNSGMLCFEAAKRNAKRVVGIDLQSHRLSQAKTIADILGFEVELLKMNLFDAVNLGVFDIVFCIAVVTEITDLIRSLEILRDITKVSLFLEMATVETYQRRGNVLVKMLNLSLGNALAYLSGRPASSSRYGSANLRRISSKRMKGWVLVPDMRFMQSILGEDFELEDLGRSIRYNLFHCSRKT